MDNTEMINKALEIIKNNDVKQLKELTNKDLDLHYDNGIFLVKSAKVNAFDCVKFLVENGVDVHSHEDNALRWAANNGHNEIAIYLIEKGADISAKNNSALRYTAYKGNQELFSYLVNQGAPLEQYFEQLITITLDQSHFDLYKYIITTSVEKKNKVFDDIISKLENDINEKYSQKQRPEIEEILRFTKTTLRVKFLEEELIENTYSPATNKI